MGDLKTHTNYFPVQSITGSTLNMASTGSRGGQQRRKAELAASKALSSASSGGVRRAHAHTSMIGELIYILGDVPDPDRPRWQELLDMFHADPCVHAWVAESTSHGDRYLEWCSTADMSIGLQAKTDIHSTRRWAFIQAKSRGLSRITEAITS